MSKEAEKWNYMSVKNKPPRRCPIQTHSSCSIYHNNLVSRQHSFWIPQTKMQAKRTSKQSSTYASWKIQDTPHPHPRSHNVPVLNNNEHTTNTPRLLRVHEKEVSYTYYKNSSTPFTTVNIGTCFHCRGSRIYVNRLASTKNLNEPAFAKLLTVP